MKVTVPVFTLGFIYFFLSVCNLSLQSQCTVDAGPDLGICQDSEGAFSPGQIEADISGGTQPYAIRWETNYHTGGQGDPVLTASHFLDDTTVANPSIIGHPYNEDPVLFHIVVEDADGVECRDSVLVTFSSFVVFGIGMEVTIQKGDTTTIHPNVDGVIPPLTFIWGPDYNISDVNAAFPLAWPDTTTPYELTLIDGLGCEFDFPVVFTVIVDSTTNIFELGTDPEPLRIYPNPTMDFAVVDLSKIRGEVSLMVTDMSGRLAMKKTKIRAGSEYVLDMDSLPPGLYHIALISEDQSGTVYQGRVLKK